MQRMKKAQMLKFLFWTIVGLAFFIPACMLGSKFMSIKDTSIESYSGLMGLVETIEEGEIASTSFSMSKKSVVVGFSKGDDRFENHFLDEVDDYCICGQGYQKIPGGIGNARCDAPARCGSPANCIMGIDDAGGYIRTCDYPFGFEKDGAEGDDYCICGTGSQDVFPDPRPDGPTSCNTICGAGKCMMGVDDAEKVRRCDYEFGFEDDTPPDDYCICGEGSVEITPGPIGHARCEDETLCGSKDTCIMGIDDAGHEHSGTDRRNPKEKQCFDAFKTSAEFGFEGRDTRKREYLKPLGCENCCEDRKACICICNGYEYKDNKVNCKDVEICRSFDNIDILSSKVVKRDDTGNPEYKWVGGFLIHRDISDSEDVNGFEKNNIQTRTFYVENYNGIISVCDERPCIPQDAKYRIDASQP